MMSENKNLRRRQKHKSNEQAADVPMMATIHPGTRVTGASKVLLDDHVHEALQNKSDDETNAQADFYVSDGDEDQFISFSSRRKFFFFIILKYVDTFCLISILYFLYIQP